MSRTPDLDKHIAQEAAEWIVRLGSDSQEERQSALREFEVWKLADSRHAAAAATIQGFIERMAPLAACAGEGRPVARSVLDTMFACPRKRGGVRKKVAALTLLIPLYVWWPNHFLADYRTDCSEQRTVQLADGSWVTLQPESAIDFSLQRDERSVILLAGEILVDVARDPRRPFVVQTSSGQIHALGTRFIVRKEKKATRLLMLESKTLVNVAEALPELGDTKRVVDAGEQVHIFSDHIHGLPRIDVAMAEQAFRSQRLIVQDRPLPEVLEQLSRYQHSTISYSDDELRHIRVSAVLPLDNIPLALTQLAEHLPGLRVRQFTPWLFWVDAS